MSSVEDPAREHALSVHASINSVFEDSIYPPGYEASFSNTLNYAEMRRLRNQSGINFSEVTPHRLSEGEVNVRVGYDMIRDRLAVKDIVLPVTRVRGSSVVGLLLRRTEDGSGRYIFAHEEYDGSANVPFAAKTIQTRAVRHLLGLCGFSTDMLPANHQKLRVSLCEMADVADTHTVVETVTVPVPNPLLSLEVTRASSLKLEKGETLARRGDICTSTPRKSRWHPISPARVPSTKTFETTLGAKTQSYDGATGKLKRVQSIVFSGHGGEIDTPVVTVDYDQPGQDIDPSVSLRQRKLPSSEVLLRAIDEALFEHLSEAEQQRQNS